MDASGDEREPSDMNLGERIRLALERRGMNQADLARAIGIKPPSLSEALKKNDMRSKRMRQVAAALRVPFDALANDEDDGPFLRALEEDDPSLPEPDPAEEPEGRSGHGVARSLLVATTIDSTGEVLGDLGLDVVTRPSGRSSRAVKFQHAKRRLDGDDDREHVLMEGVPLGAELVKLTGRIDLADEDRSIYPGDFLVVERGRQPEAGRYVIAKRDAIDHRAPAADPMGGPEVRLFRYHPAGRGYSLEPVDGSGRNVGPGDGWEVVAVVLFWRSP